MPPSVASPHLSPLISSYSRFPNVWDELTGLNAIGPADSWTPLLKHIGRIGAAELNRRWEQALRLMRESGVTQNLGDKVNDLDRPWVLDPVPFVISRGEWAKLSGAVAQRARLLNAILDDLYGQQQLLRAGLLPPELVYGHPGYLRPVHGPEMTQSDALHFYAVDVARRPNGGWVAISDRTQSPSGIGYALENRLVTLRMMPETYRDCAVQHLLPFFKKIRETLRSIAVRNQDNPRIVLLTAGPANSSYFEQIFLARHLGVPLVEGNDLTVRDNGVYLKTLGGLQMVDVILRRIEDSLCDPLELRYDSLSGVPGLVQAVASGKVVVANALGSGLLNTPVFLPFLPDLCPHLLGEDLALGSLETRWCASAGVIEALVANFSNFLLKTTFPEPGDDPVDCASLSAGERAELLARVKAEPHGFVTQERIALSTSPSWNRDHLVPRHTILRLYAVATGGGEYMVMPGGRALVGEDASAGVVTLETSSASKDVWVLGESVPTAPSILQHLATPGPLKRSGMDMPSRVADHLFWLGRYAERAEDAIRLLRALVLRVTDETGFEKLPELETLVNLLAQMELAPPAIVGTAAPERRGELEEALLASLFEDDAALTNVRQILRSLRRAAWMVRDRISQDAWRALNRLGSEFPTPEMSRQLALSEALASLDDMIMPLSAFSGLAMESTTRGPGWRFLDIGRRLERAMATVTLLSPLAAELKESEPYVLQALLEIADSSMTYRSRYLSSIQIAAALDLLLRDETSPRSVAFQLVAIQNHLDALPRDMTAADLGTERRLILSCLSGVQLADIGTLCKADKEGVRRSLARLLEKIAAELPMLSDALSSHYFSHSEAHRQLTDS